MMQQTCLMNQNPRSISLIRISLNLTLVFSLLAPAAYGADEHSTAHDGITITQFQLKRGERLFYGVIPLGEGAIGCISCHNTREMDTLNWNPSAYDIAVTSAEKSLEEFTAVLLSPSGQMMSKVHQHYDLSEDDLILIKAYLSAFKEEGLTPIKPAITKRFLFVLAILLILAAITDLAVTRRIKFKFLHALLILAGLFYIVDTTVREAIAIGRSPGYAPDQPIKFSHQIHTGQNKIDCLYCHNTAEFSKSAGIPAAAVCLNCHQLVVKEGSRSGSFEINKIIRAVENNEPIVWNRVYNLPDHVFFSHAQHVKVGGLECTQCHGAVEEMHIIRQFNDLSMGWCINCHRDTEVQFIDNAFYEQYEKLHQELKQGKRDRVSVEDIGGIECMKCHY
jgi:cytochrome c553